MLIPSITSTLREDLAIADTSFDPSPSLHVTSVTLGQDRKILCAHDGRMTVCICGSVVFSNAFLRAVVICECACITRRVCRLGRALRQAAKAGSTVSVEQRVKDTVTVLGSEFRSEQHRLSRQLTEHALRDADISPTCAKSSPGVPRAAYTTLSRCDRYRLRCARSI